MICEDMHDLMTESPAGSAWMGLDLGTKTIGVAVSDRLLSCATPLHTIQAGEILQRCRSSSTDH
jgi:putative Holliday junction resolvase